MYAKLKEESERYKRALGETRSLLRGAEAQIAEWRTVIQDLTYSLETERLLSHSVLNLGSVGIDTCPCKMKLAASQLAFLLPPSRSNWYTASKGIGFQGIILGP
ncbi:hypothetical protein AVEN_242440-1 [Araneus ventricosus]|uniref:Uncharacterized protein n=1 Tax=Araneus ventricosus TaxID=182803 RepID=A0A4Y2WTJ6_ARAVE|nr:hypothetical protein AVEN_242440-1 [Araneus ventricosus]